LLADSHCHFDSFKGRKELIEAYSNAGVKFVVSNATNPDSVKAHLGFADEHPSLLIALGLHPVDILSLSSEEIDSSFSIIKDNIGKAVAVGEVGLDFKYADESQRVFQEDVFRRFINLATENKKPLVVHARYAETQCLNILEELSAKNVQMHWFTNSKKTSKRAVELGYFISCGPIILSDLQTQSVVKEIPLENLLLETDCPVPFLGVQSDPSWISRVCEKVAEIKCISPEKVSLVTGKNFSKLFHK